MYISGIKQEEARKNKIRKIRKYLSEWHEIYAWLPIISNHQFWWLEKVRRKAVYIDSNLLGLKDDMYYSEFGYWEYEKIKEK